MDLQTRTNQLWAAKNSQPAITGINLTISNLKCDDILHRKLADPFSGKVGELVCDITSFQAMEGRFLYTVRLTQMLGPRGFLSEQWLCLILLFLLDVHRG